MTIQTLTNAERAVLRVIDQTGDPYRARRGNPLAFDAKVRNLLNRGFLRRTQVIVDHVPYNTLALTERGTSAIAGAHA